MQRYFINKQLINLDEMSSKIIGNDYHHIKNVMRMKESDRIILLDNENNEYLCEIDSFNQGFVQVRILEVYQNKNEICGYVTICQGLVRKDKIEEVCRRLVELGCNDYLSVKMERCNISLKSKDDYKFSRLETIVKEASEQSERGKMMNLLGYKSFKEFLSFASSYDNKFVCYEDSGRSNDSSIYKHLDKLSWGKTIVLVGPEGGISLEEIKTLKDNGFICIGLGKRILRTETAPLMIMGIISSYLDYKQVGDNNEN